MKKYRIYPPIGVARIGDSDEYYFGPESLDSIGTFLDGSEIKSTKDSSGRIMRQAAQFKIYEFSEEFQEWRVADLPEGAKVEWSIKVSNFKDAEMSRGAHSPSEMIEPPASPAYPKLDSALIDREIYSEITLATELNSGTSAVANLEGSYLDEPVFLAQVLADSDGLVFLGGTGKSSSPEGRTIGAFNTYGSNYYNNRGWYDDVCDGQVNAKVLLDGVSVGEVSGSWIIVAPPNFAPSVQPLVSLYDVILQVAYDQGWRTLPEKADFSSDIRPILENFMSLRWVNQSYAWDSIEIGLFEGDQQKRREIAEKVKNLSSSLERGHKEDSPYLLPWQLYLMDQWVEGNFEDNGNSSQDLLTKGALSACVGRAFYPGIEAGIILENPEIYEGVDSNGLFDFRISQSNPSLRPGSLTALMALPWQADFLKCSTNWWPTQRPNIAYQTDGSLSENWMAPLNNHKDLVDQNNVMKLGVIVEKNGELVEDGRIIGNELA